MQPLALLRGLSWTVGSFAGTIVIRFGTNVLLTRLLTPELFGALLIVNTVRQGIDLSSDVGFPQNTVQNPAGNTPAFYNTVWIMQIVRGFVLCAVLFFLAEPIARLYGLPAVPFEIAAATFAVSGLTSTSIYLVHRKMEFAKFSLFEFAQDTLSSLLLVAVAFVSPTINALLIGGLVALTIRTISSYFLLPERNRIQFSKQHAVEVLMFGRWIFVSSILAFLCANFDRLYIGKVLPLAIVGIYGIARNLADLPILLMSRVGYQLVFPLISSKAGLPTSEVRAQLSSTRRWLLLAAALIIAAGIAVSDVAVRVVYDSRYQDAAWMLAILLFGVWFSMLCSLNEYALLGRGKPGYIVFGNALKLVLYLVMLPLAFHQIGILGVSVVIALSDSGRYLAIAFGQWREEFSFFRQDAVATLIFLAAVAAVSWLRFQAGFGTAFDNVPLDAVGDWLGR